MATAPEPTPYEDFSDGPGVDTRDADGNIVVGPSSILRADASGVVRVPFWGDNPGVWDRVLIEGRALPGIVVVTGEGFEQRVRKTKAKGRHGATHRYVGTASVDFELLLSLWTPEHLDAFSEVVALVTHHKPPVTRLVKQKVQVGYTGEDQTTGVTTTEVLTKEVLESTGPRTVEVYHPALAIFGIRSATVMRVSLPTRQQREDRYQASMRLSQLKLGNLEAGTGVKKGSASGASDTLGKASRAVPSSTLLGTG